VLSGLDHYKSFVVKAKCRQTVLNHSLFNAAQFAHVRYTPKRPGYSLSSGLICC